MEHYKMATRHKEHKLSEFLLVNSQDGQVGAHVRLWVYDMLDDEVLSVQQSEAMPVKLREGDIVNSGLTPELITALSEFLPGMNLTTLTALDTANAQLAEQAQQIEKLATEKQAAEATIMTLTAQTTALEATIARLTAPAPSPDGDLAVPDAPSPG